MTRSLQVLLVVVMVVNRRPWQHRKDHSTRDEAVGQHAECQWGVVNVTAWHGCWMLSANERPYLGTSNIHWLSVYTRCSATNGDNGATKLRLPISTGCRFIPDALQPTVTQRCRRTTVHRRHSLRVTSAFDTWREVDDDVIQRWGGRTTLAECHWGVVNVTAWHGFWMLSANERPYLGTSNIHWLSVYTGWCSANGDSTVPPNTHPNYKNNNKFHSEKIGKKQEKSCHLCYTYCAYAPWFCSETLMLYKSLTCVLTFLLTYLLTYFCTYLRAFVNYMMTTIKMMITM